MLEQLADDLFTAELPLRMAVAELGDPHDAGAAARFGALDALARTDRFVAT
jgi:hypothetical protein